MLAWTLSRQSHVMKLRVTIIAAILTIAPAAHAENATSLDMSGIFQVVLGLAIVLALLFASLWLLKRLAAPRGAAAGFMKVITATAVGTRERVVVVEVGDTWLVLGVAPGSVTPLHQLPRQDVTSASPAASGDFAARLGQFMDRGKRAS
jgi:flagellar protein FliO/FliZ